ncbi:hypothetical protein MKZ38_008531 [Zalerion maritima]|uniref:Uncharacterized protein n=1 Tax=Zalerion maritima TaxID=339359 RepID=A0AAD5RVR8_9PEZI|nr:hypothetical protein MKZ38_008531 [Zalerion maritima]
MAAVPQSFYCLWQDNNIRETLFSMLPKEDLASVRTANTACCNLLTKRLFLRTHVTFTPNTFTRPSRVHSLSRIGHNIEHLTFYFPHTEATFLPPLIHPESGHEITFLYTPHTSMGSVLTRPKYANSQLGDILTAQYPPLFHSATNVPSFIHAMCHMPNMRHLTIKTPGQDPTERYRRDIVDYALISLRVSLERSTLSKLNKLSLTAVHPSSFLYLRPLFALGCRPSAAKRWRQIRKLHISVESWDFYGPNPGMDHLKLIDDFVRNFSCSLEKVTFAWLGRKGPCPIALGGDPLFAPPKSSKKLFNEVTSPMSPLPPRPAREQMRFPRLKFMQVRNATMNAPQISTLVAAHRDTVREFDFDNVALTSGSWDEALAPLTEKSVQRSSRGSYLGGLTGRSEVWARSDANLLSAGSFNSGSFRSISEEELPTPSAAVEAASRDLFDEELEKNLFGIMGGPYDDEQEKEKRDKILNWAAQTPIPDASHSQAPSPAPVTPTPDNGKFVFDEEDAGEETEREERYNRYEFPCTPPPPSSRYPPTEDFPLTHDYPPLPTSSNPSPLRSAGATTAAAEALEDDMASEIAAAREASESFSTKVKKRKVKKRRRRKPRADGLGYESGYETEKTEQSSRSAATTSSSKNRKRKESHKKERLSEEKGEEINSSGKQKLSRSRSHRKHKRISSIPDVPEIPADLIPEVLDDAHVVSPSTISPHVSEVLPPLPLLVRSNTMLSSRSNNSQHSQNSQKSKRSFRSFKSLRSLRSRPSISEEETFSGPPTPTIPEMVISDPVMATSEDDPSILLLQPTVYDPKGIPTAGSGAEAATMEGAHEITAVQRNLEQEEKHRLMAEDEGLRKNALSKAKAMVMAKLSREFPVKEERSSKGERTQGGATGAARKRLMDYTFGHGGGQQNGGGGYGAVYGSGNGNGDISRTLPTRNWWGGKSVMSVASECRTLDSQSAVVPLIISR